MTIPIISLHTLADYIAKSDHFDQSDGATCAFGHALQLAQMPGYPSGDPYAFATQALKINREEAAAIWLGHYPTRRLGKSTQRAAVEYVRQLADKYEPVKPEPMPEERVLEPA